MKIKVKKLVAFLLMLLMVMNLAPTGPIAEAIGDALAGEQDGQVVVISPSKQLLVTKDQLQSDEPEQAGEEEPLELKADQFSVSTLDADTVSSLVNQYIKQAPSAGAKRGLMKAAARSAAPSQQHTDYAAFDIELADGVEGKSFRVPVALKKPLDMLAGFRQKDQSITVTGVSYELYHIHDGQATQVSVSADADDGVLSGFTFVTDSFSSFVLKYTVDFHYNGVDYSIPGNSQILLSELIAQLNIRNGDALLNVADVANVTFSSAHLVNVEAVGGLITYNGHENVDVGEKDFLLSSLAPFQSKESLSIYLTSGSVIIVGVTDDAEYYDTIHLRGRNKLTLQEVLGEKYKDSMIFYSQSPSTVTLEDDRQAIGNLASVPYDDDGYVFIWDWDENAYIYYIFFQQDIIYKVSETGEIPVSTVVESAGLTGGNYWISAAGAYNSAVDTNSDSTAFVIRSLNIPSDGVLFYVMDQDTYSLAPFGILIKAAGTRTDDGVFTYEIDETERTATITGFVSTFAGVETLNVPSSVSYTFDGDSAATNVPITAVAANAFANNALIRNVTFQGGIDIGNAAFKKCPNIAKVVFEGDAGIGANAFEESAVTSVAFRASANISGFAFKHCHGLTQVTNSGTMNIGEQGFNSCYALTGEMSKLGTIGAYAFTGTAVNTFTLDHLDGIASTAFVSLGQDGKATADLVLAADTLYIPYTAGVSSKTNSFKTITVQAKNLSFGTWGMQGEYYEANGSLLEKIIINCENPITLVRETFGYEKNNAFAGVELNALVDSVNTRAFYELGKGASSNIVIDFNEGVNTIKANAFEDAQFGASTVINIADNGGQTTVEEGAFPASENLTIHFDMYRENVIGADALDALAGVTVTYKGHAAPADYRREGKQQILLSKLLSSLTRINPYDGTAIKVKDVASVAFPDEEVTVEEVSGFILYNRTQEADLETGDNVGEKDYLLTKDAAFSTATRMTVTTTDGKVYEFCQIFEYTAQEKTFTLSEMAQACGYSYTAFSSLSGNNALYFTVSTSEADYDAALGGYTDAAITINRDLPEKQYNVGLYSGGKLVAVFLITQGDQVVFEDALVDDGGIFTIEIDETANTVTITGLASAYEGGDVTIPATLAYEGVDYTVAAIADYAFRSEARLTNVIFGNGDSVIDVGDCAFCACGELLTVSGSGKITFHQQPFTDNDKLTTLTVNLADGTGAFLATYNPVLTTVTVNGAAIDNLSSFYFYDNDALTTVNLNGGVKAFSANAFALCEALTTVNLSADNGAITVAKDAFKDNASLTSAVTVAQTVESEDGTVALSADENGVRLGAKLVINNRDENAAIKADAAAFYAGAKQGYAVDYYDLSLVAPDGSVVSAAADVTLALNVKWEPSADVPAPNAKVFHVSGGNVERIDAQATLLDGELTDVAFHTDGFSPFGVGYEVDDRYHDDMYWYTLDTSDPSAVQATIVGVYDGFAGDTLTLRTATNDENKYPVAGIRADAFQDDTQIKAITGGNDLNGFVIGENAFAGMQALESVAIGASENASGSVTIQANAFKGCAALGQFTCNYSGVSVEADAFAGCSDLETVVFTGKGNIGIVKDAFKGAPNIRYLRIDNPTNMQSGAFAATNGAAFVQNNDAPLADSLEAKIGRFETYVYATNPYTRWSNSTFSGSGVKTVYFANATKNLIRDVVDVIRSAGPNLRDVYIDCDRADVSFADALDAANAGVRIHYRESSEIRGFYLDGVDGDDATANGSYELPYKTFGKLAEAWDSLTVDESAEPVEEYATEVTEAVNAAMSAVSVNKTASAFKTNVTYEKIAYIKNTVTVTGSETWNSEGSDTIVLNRDPAFKGVMVQNKGTLTLKKVELDGNKAAVTAVSPIIKSTGTLNIQEGAVIRNNRVVHQTVDYDDWAGGIYAQGTVNMTGGEISGNQGYMGGGIALSYATFTMDGGKITGNAVAEITERSSNGGKMYYSNGGGVFLSHSKMYLKSGEVSYNTANQGASYWNGQAGGGISVGGGNSAFCSAQLYMTGGLIKGNTAGANGGGIYIEDSCEAHVSGGRIENNKAEDGVFGGGGIYVNGNRAASDGVLYLTKAVITDNTSIADSSEAYGGGGGLGGCNTSSTSVYQLDGAAIYGNHSQTGADVYFDNIVRNRQSSPRGYVTQYMFDGTENNWTDPRTNQPISAADAANIYNLLFNHVALLKANPDREPVGGQVFITGNVGGLGGGVGSNGSVIIGKAPEPQEVTWTPAASKILYNRDMEEGETFTYRVYEEKSSQGFNWMWTQYNDVLIDTVSGTVTGGKANTPQKITFNRAVSLGRVTAADIGTIRTFLLVENQPASDAIWDRKYFAFNVAITSTWDESANKEVLSAETLDIETGRVLPDGTFDYDDPTNTSARMSPTHNFGRIRSKTGKAEFHNYAPYTSLTAEKIWDYLGQNTVPEGAKVVFELYADGKATGKRITVDGTADAGLDTDNDGKADQDGELTAWTAQWVKVPIYRTNGAGEIYKIHDYDEDYARVEYAIMEISCEPACYAPSLAGNHLTATTQSAVFNLAHNYYYDSITLELYADGEPTGKQITLDVDTDWHHWQDDPDAWVATWTDLPVYRLDEDGNLYKEHESDLDYARIQYTVRVVDFVEDEWNREGDQPPFSHDEPQPISLLIPVTDLTRSVSFTNVYSAKGEATLSGVKMIENRSFRAGDAWTFRVTAEEGVPMPEKTSVTIKPTSGSSASVSFGEIKYTEADIGKTYKYTITESGAVASVTNDQPKTVTIRVEDNKDGTLKLVKMGNDGDAFKFVNTYAATGKATFQGVKMIENRAFTQGDSLTVSVTGDGRLPADPEITVQLKPGETTADYSFAPIPYELSDLGGKTEKTFTYTFTETANMAGTQPDSSTHTAQVRLTDDGKGHLVSEVTYSDGDKVQFVNPYFAQGETTLEAEKQIENRAFQEGDQWTFRVTAAEGAPMPEETEAILQPADGSTAAKIDFGKLRFTQADAGKTYEYTITESGDVAGVTNDAARTVTVHVEDNLDGTLKITNSSEDTPVVFVNTYHAAGEVTLEGVKKLSGREFREGDEWTFTLSAVNAPMPEQEQVTIKPTRGSSEAFSFGLIRFTEADAGKTYAYVITETGTVANVKNDAAKTVTLQVEDQGDGTLKVTSSVDETGLVFTNTYNPPPEVTPTPTPTATPTPTPVPQTVDVAGEKTWEDDENADGMRPESITIRLLANGTEIDHVTVTEADGWAWRFESLDQNDIEGAEITYTIQEDPVEHYTAKVEGFDVINTYVREETSVSVRKVWDDNNNQYRMRPSAIRVTLSEGTQVILSADNDWSATVEHLPVYRDGEKIEYTWKEQEVLGYSLKSVTVQDGVTILTNSFRKPPEDVKPPKHPGVPVEEFEDYETPLAIDVIINHVGDCYD